MEVCGKIRISKGVCILNLLDAIILIYSVLPNSDYARLILSKILNTCHTNNGDGWRYVGIIVRMAFRYG